MLETSKIEELTARAVELIAADGIRFLRGDPREYMLRVARANAGLTLPLVPPASEADAVWLKIVYSLWNIVVDDEIDREGKRTGLDHSACLLIDRSLRTISSPIDSGAAKLLAYVLSRLPDAGEERLGAIDLDWWDIVNGFNYEYHISRSRGLANSVEYRKYSTMTASLKIHLDIDLAFSKVSLSQDVYRKLRLAYEHLSSAIKYASDIGSLRRELVEEDNLNIVRIAAMEMGRADLAAALRADEYHERLGSLRDVIEETRAAARMDLEAAQALLASVPEVDTRPVLRAATHVFTGYASGSDF